MDMKVNLFDFVKETPDSYLQRKSDVDERVYLPYHLLPTEKKDNPRGGKDICEPKNVPCYLNKESCTTEGYTLISNGSKGRGKKNDNVFAYYKYELRCQHSGRLTRGSTSKKYKQGESAAPLRIDK